MRDFEVFGLLEDEWQAFRKDANYSAFIARRK